MDPSCLQTGGARNPGIAAGVCGAESAAVVRHASARRCSAFNQIWVDPAAGNDGNSGASRALAVRTLSEAWRRVPINVDLSTGFQINLTAGTYAESAVPNYWESRHGTQSAPIVIEAIDGDGTARLPNMNVYDCRHLYILGLDISSGGGDVLHLDSCSYVLLRGTTIRGVGDIPSYAVPQESLKVNQSQYIYVEQCDISGAGTTPSISWRCSTAMWLAAGFIGLATGRCMRRADRRR